jgi:hypothetical protein
MKIILVSTVLLATVANLVTAQFNGPVPPRLNIPGAVPVPIRIPQRERVLQHDPHQVVRVRRPQRPIQIQPVIPQARFVEPQEAKPVIEEPEDSEEYAPQNFQPIAPPSTSAPLPPPQQPQQQQHHHQQHQQQQQQHEIPSNAQRFNVERPKPQFRQLQHQQRPQQHFQQQQDDEYDEIPSRPVHRPQTKQHHSAPPHQPQAHHHSEKPKKPVAQILRKYREEHEDGSITWGYENDDGSYKEEFIGVDCITRGKYGYIDTEGNKREFTYETGIYCDPNKKDEEDDEELDSYVNYDENRAVFPNGAQLNLDQMSKHKAKRPGQYRN